VFFASSLSVIARHNGRSHQRPLMIAPAVVWCNACQAGPNSWVQNFVLRPDRHGHISYVRVGLTIPQ